MDLQTKLESLKPSQLKCNFFSVYDYDGYTIQELLCQFFTAINGCIDISNKTIDLATWLVNEGLEQEVAKKLDLWVTDGTLEQIINHKIFEDLNTKINTNTGGLNALRTDFNNFVKRINSVQIYDVDYPNLQIAHDAVIAKGGGSLIITKDHSLDSKFIWDVSKVYINGNGHILDLSNVTTTYAMHCFSNNKETHPYYQATNGIDRLKIRGNRLRDGILFEGEGNGKDVSHITFNQCEISNFRTNISIGNNSYLIKFVDCDIYNSDRVFRVLENVVNTGENIQFRGCALYNCTGGFLSKNGLVDIFLSDCSLDYFEQGSIIDILDTKMYFNNCHIEFSTKSFKPGFVPISAQGDSGFISFNNCQFIGDKPTETTVPNIFYTKGSQARISLTNCNMWGLKTTSGFLCGGEGNLVANGTCLNIVPSTDTLIHPNVTQCAIGNMTNDVFTDIFITEDTETINSITQTGANIKITYDKTLSYKYGRSIKVAKTFGGGSASAFVILAPIDRGSTNGADITIKKTSGSGKVYITFGYCSREGFNLFKSEYGTETKVYIDSETDWEHTTKYLTRAPQWATHVFMAFNLSEANSINFNIGEILVNSF